MFKFVDNQGSSKSTALFFLFFLVVGTGLAIFYLSPNKFSYLSTMGANKEGTEEANSTANFSTLPKEKKIEVLKAKNLQELREKCRRDSQQGGYSDSACYSQTFSKQLRHLDNYYNALFVERDNVETALEEIKEERKSAIEEARRKYPVKKFLPSADVDLKNPVIKKEWETFKKITDAKGKGE